MVTIYMLRHGETNYNRKGIVQGSGVDSSLNEKGREQANFFFETYKHLRFDAVYSSMLKRTKETIDPWIKQGYYFERDRGLNELNWGIQEGKVPSREAASSFRQTLANWQAGKLHDKVEEGESPIEAWERAGPFFSKLRKKHKNQQLLLCSHGRQIRVILSQLLGHGLHKMELFPSENTALNLIYLYSNGRSFAERLNDTSHLIHPK